MFGFDSKDFFFLVFLQKCMMSRHVCHLQPTQGLTRRSVRAKNGNTANEQQCTHCKGKWNHNCPKKPQEHKKKSRGPVPQNLENKITQFSRGPGDGGGKPRILEYIYIYFFFPLFFCFSKGFLDFFKGLSPKSLRIYVFVFFQKLFRFLQGALPKEP